MTLCAPIFMCYGPFFALKSTAIFKAPIILVKDMMKSDL